MHSGAMWCINAFRDPSVCRRLTADAAIKRLLWDVLLIHRTPDRYLRHAWDILHLANVAINVTVVPFCVSFLDNLRSIHGHGVSSMLPWETAMLGMDVLYLADIAMQGRCAESAPCCLCTQCPDVLRPLHMIMCTRILWVSGFLSWTKMA